MKLISLLGLGLAFATSPQIISGSESGDGTLAAAQQKYEASRAKKVEVPFGIELEKLNQQLDKALSAEEISSRKGLHQGRWSDRDPGELKPGSLRFRADRYPRARLSFFHVAGRRP